MLTGGQKMNFDEISAQKSHFGLANGYRSMDLGKILQKLTSFDFSQNSRLRRSAKGPKSTKIDPTNYISA